MNHSVYVAVVIRHFSISSIEILKCYCYTKDRFCQ